MHLKDKKEKAILDWLTPKRLTDVISFQVLSSLYIHFIKSFNSIITLMMDAWKKNEFHWTSKAKRSIQQLKFRLLVEAHLLALPELSKATQVVCDDSSVGIGVVLMQEGRLGAYFSGKFNDLKLDYLIYGELFAIVKALGQREHYFIGVEFVLYFDHEVFGFLKVQKKLNSGHISCVCYFKKFSSVSQHKDSSLIGVIDALSQRYGLMDIISCEIIGLNLTPDCYAVDPFLSKVLNDVRNGKSQGYLMIGDFLFRGNWLCQLEELWNCLKYYLLVDFVDILIKAK